MLQTITPRVRDRVSGRISVASQVLLEAKLELLSSEQTHRTSQAIGQLTKAWDEANKALRFVDYLLEEPDKVSGQEETSGVAND